MFLHVNLRPPHTGRDSGMRRDFLVFKSRQFALKPVTDEQVFYDKFLCDKFYLLVCTRNFDNFFNDKCTCS